MGVVKYALRRIRLQAWLLTKLWLISLLPSLIARQWAEPLNDGFLINPSRKHAYIILTPLNPSFIVKGYTLFVLFRLKNIDCGYSLEPPRRSGSNEFPQSMFWTGIWKISEFLFENFQVFLVVEFSIYFNRRVFVMFFRVLRSDCKRSWSGPPRSYYWFSFPLASDLH